MLKYIMGLVYPVLCPVCHEPLTKNEKTICIKCLHGLNLSPFKADEANETEKMLWGRYPIVRGAGYCRFVKGGISQQILHEIKYRANKELAVEMGRQMGLKKQILDIMNCDCIVPVPLHKSKLKQRGYNQSLLLAEGMSAECGLPVENSVLVRSSANKTETKTGGMAYGRWQNTLGIFSINEANKERLQGKHVLLVDDVITSGATIEACCVALNEIEGIRISFYCFATASII